MINFIKKYWRSIIIAIIIFLLSVIDFSTVNNIPKVKYSDKIIHLFMYAVLAFVMLFEAREKQDFKQKSYLQLLFILIIPIVFGGLIEIIQQNFFPPRTAEWLDWLSDIVGVALGGISAFFYFKRLK